MIINCKSCRKFMCASTWSKDTKIKYLSLICGNCGVEVFFKDLSTTMYEPQD